jgi:hypothetical protein
MKRLIIIAVFIPLFSSAQKFEVSEMMGYSDEVSHILDVTPSDTKGKGFSNRISFHYYMAKIFSIGALYEFNAWKPSNNAIGIVPEFHFGSFYSGVTISDLFQNKIIFGTPSQKHYISYNPSLSIGMHLGIVQTPSKHISIKEQLGFCYSSVSTNVDYALPGFTQNLRYFSILVGVAYRL